MATKRGAGDAMEPTKAAPTRKAGGAAAGSGAAARTTRGAAKPNGPASPTAEGGAGRRGGAAKGTSTRAAGGTKAAAGSKSAEGTKAGAGAKTNTRASGRATAKSTGATGRRSGASKTDLKKDLRDFASTRPQGWSHDDWLRFLDDLQARGHNISDRDQIGSLLEKERLSLALERIPALSAARARTIAERYGYLWRLKETDADQLSSEAKIPRPVAEKVLEGLRS